MTNDRYKSWLVQTVSLVMFVNGLTAVFRPLAQKVPEKVQDLIVPLSVDFAARSFELMIGVALIFFSYQLLSRRITAWWIALIGGSLLVVIRGLTTRSLVPVLIPLFSLAILVVCRSYFRAKSEPVDMRKGLMIFAICLSIAVIYGTVGFWYLSVRDFGLTFSFWESIVRTLRIFALLGNTDLVAQTNYASWFLDSVSVIGISSFVFALYSLFRPIAYKLQTQPHERQLMEQLLKQYSLSSDDYFKLWPHDKSYYYLPNNAAAMAYAVNSGVALVVGDPVGDKNDIKRLINSFSETCSQNSWLPAFIYITDHYLKIYQKLGYELTKIGEDAIVDLATFTTSTASNKHFRNIFNRFSKEGYVLTEHFPPHAAEVLNEVTVISDQWLTGPDRKEWAFLAGSFSRDYMAESPLFIVRDGTGKAHAFVNQIPVYQKGVATIDLMRYDPESPSNVMDFLLASIMLNLASRGYTSFSLGLAPLAGLGGESSQPEEKLLDLIYRMNYSFISFQGLRRYKQKFEPIWQPKYIAYPGTSARLPLIAFALSKAMSSSAKH